MSQYRKIEIRTWSDVNFRALSPLAKLLWFFLLTGPQNGPIPGLYRAGRAAMAEELDWPQDDFDPAFAELEDLGMVQPDWKARLIWVPSAMLHNKPESPNVVRSWHTELDLLPECALKREALASIRLMMVDMSESTVYADAFEDALAGANKKAGVARQISDTEGSEPDVQRPQEPAPRNRKRS